MVYKTHVCLFRGWFTILLYQPYSGTLNLSLHRRQRNLHGITIPGHFVKPEYARVVQLEKAQARERGVC